MYIPPFRGHSDHTRLPGLASVDDVTSFFLEAKNGETSVELSWKNKKASVYKGQTSCEPEIRVILFYIRAPFFFFSPYPIPWV